MTSRSRLLTAADSQQTPPGVQTLDSDFVVILFVLLCALFCVLGLVAVAPSDWISRLLSRSSASSGVGKKVLELLPKRKYGDDQTDSDKFTECAICLSEFTSGEEFRKLPQCGHGFHVPCIDTWLASHSSCPTCRQILVVAPPLSEMRRTVGIQHLQVHCNKSG